MLFIVGIFLYTFIDFCIVELKITVFKKQLSAFLILTLSYYSAECKQKAIIFRYSQLETLFPTKEM